MSILASILNTLVVILAVLLIALILVQPTKSGGGFGSAFGGLGESVFGAQAMSHLSKLTVWCISIFFVLTLASAIVAGHVQTVEKPKDDKGIGLAGQTDPKAANAPDTSSQSGQKDNDELANPSENPKNPKTSGASGSNGAGNEQSVPPSASSSAKND